MNLRGVVCRSQVSDTRPVRLAFGSLGAGSGAPGKFAGSRLRERLGLTPE